MAAEISPKYLRVKRKRKDKPNINETQFKKCKYIASLESHNLEDVQNLLNVNEIKDYQLVDIDQDNSVSGDCDMITDVKPEDSGI
jgi:hypothetical protein